MGCKFNDPDLFDALEAVDDATLDALPFGVVAMAPDGTVTGYNLAESAISGLKPANVIGRLFFSGVIPRTDNFIVAQRFETETVLDEVIDYVAAVGMRPTPLRGRLLKEPGRRRMYFVLERR